MEFLSGLWESFVPHWPFFAAVIVFMVVGEVMKRAVLTPEHALKSRIVHWLRRTMALHPVASGALLGLLPGVPVSPGIETLAGRMLYFGMAGAVSIWAYHVIDDWAEKRGIYLHIPGLPMTHRPGPRTVAPPPVPKVSDEAVIHASIEDD